MATRRSRPLDPTSPVAGGRFPTGSSRTWSYTVGQPPYTVTAAERRERGGRIEVRWWIAAKRSCRRVSLGFAIRDKRGAIVETLRQEAARHTQEIYHQLQAGRDPATAVMGSTPDDDATEQSGPLTLAQGFDRATTVPTGLYVVETEHLREIRRAKTDVVELIGIAEDGRPQTWDNLTYGTVRRIWLGLAERYKAEARGGPKWAERIVVFVIQISQWLLSEEKTSRAVAMRKNWREKLRDDWQQMTGVVVEARRPRYSAAEVAKLFAALDHPDIDPRLKLLVQLGAEARLGQVARLQSSDVDLSDSGAYGLGRYTVRGRGKKLGVKRDFTLEERAAFDAALMGYLAPLQEAHLAGTLEDYYVFPRGMLRYDVPPSRRPQRYGQVVDIPLVRRTTLANADRPIGTEALNRYWRALEDLAKVEHVPKRAWYGLRRAMADLAEDVAPEDERVLNSLTGHLKSETRREIYQERDRETIRAKAAEARTRIRRVAANMSNAELSKKPGSTKHGSLNSGARFQPGMQRKPEKE